MRGEAGSSTGLKRKLAGAAYLVVNLGGLFVQAGVFQPLTHGPAAATAQAIAENKQLWRIGIAVNAAYLLANIPLGILLYELFGPVRQTLARCALAYILICAAIEAVNLALLYAPLALGGEVAGLGEAQRQALGYLAISLHPVGFGIALLFFAAFCVLTGVLILRSDVAPRAIGWLMMLAGGCYATNTLAMLAAPGVWDRLTPWVLLPCLLAELSLATWLIAGGRKLDLIEP